MIFYGTVLVYKLKTNDKCLTTVKQLKQMNSFVKDSFINMLKSLQQTLFFYNFNKTINIWNS